MSSSTKIAQLYPGRIIIAAVAALIIIGTFLLSLSAAQKYPIALIDTCFMATSSACVTGLFSTPVASLTGFGQCILLLLIQIGGLGIVTLTLFLMSLFTNLGFSTQLLAGQILDLGQWKHVRIVLVRIVLFTLTCEFLGAIAIFLSISHRYTLSRALFLSLFQSVSSFCNAGISLFELNSELLSIGSHLPLLITTTLLMFAGSFGFIVFIDLFNQLKMWQKRKRLQLSLTSKLILQAHAILITVSTIAFFVLEYNNSFRGMGLGLSLANALFLSVSLRSTGFLTRSLLTFRPASLFLMFPLSFIGSAPGSTSSGIKTTTISIVLATIWAAVTGAKAVNIFGRRIHKDQIFKAFAIVLIGIGWLLLATFLLLLADPQLPFLQICIEAISAFTNVGISEGMTPLLSGYSKFVLIISMIVGRVGSLTLISSLRRLSAIQKAQRIDEVMYPKERIMLN